MYRAWRIIRTLSAAAGLMLLIMAVGTSDYHVMELGTDEPVIVWKAIVLGILMMLPAYIHAFRKEWEEMNDVEDR